MNSYSTKLCQWCGKEYTKNIFVCRKQWEKSKFCSRRCEGLRKRGIRTSPSTEFKKGQSASPSTQFKKGTRGAEAPSWKGGRTPLGTLIRSLPEYKNWRIAVFERDDYTCQMCGVRGQKLHADHIKPFALILRELDIKSTSDAMEAHILWDIANGRTLCVECHKKTPTYLNPKVVHAK